MEARDRRWRWWIGRAAGVVIGAVLLFAALTKAIAPGAFAQQIRAHALDALAPAAVLVVVALALEAGLGLALILGVRRLWVLLPTAGLVVFFLVLTGRAAWGDAPAAAEAGCGCFGNVVDRSPQEAFWQDLALLVPPLALAFIGRGSGREPRPRLRLVAVALGTGAVLLLAWRAPQLPLDDLATRLRPGVAVEELCAGSEPRICLSEVAPDLQEQGERWVVMLDLEATEPTTVETLNGYAMSGTEPALVALTAADQDEVSRFTWEMGPAFPIHQAPAALLATMHRRLPRSFRVEAGVVRATHPGIAPALDRTGGAEQTNRPSEETDTT